MEILTNILILSAPITVSFFSIAVILTIEWSFYCADVRRRGWYELLKYESKVWKFIGWVWKAVLVSVLILGILMTAFIFTQSIQLK